jgi:hypothetical protein
MWFFIVSFLGMAAALGYAVWYMKMVADTGPIGNEE